MPHVVAAALHQGLEVRRFVQRTDIGHIFLAPTLVAPSVPRHVIIFPYY